MNTQEKAHKVYEGILALFDVPEEVKDKIFHRILNMNVEKLDQLGLIFLNYQKKFEQDQAKLKNIIQQGLNDMEELQEESDFQKSQNSFFDEL